MKHLFVLIALLVQLQATAQSGALKTVVYDFDGLDYGMTSLPDGDYSTGDLSYFVTGNPLAASEVLGDRVLECDLNWSSGTGDFGKGISRFFEFDAARDHINFYIYNPLSNTGTAAIKLNITEDDNQNDTYESSADDKWTYTLTVNRSGGWQFFSVPLSSFTDANSGGNGIFDAAYTAAAGMLFNVSFTFTKPTSVSTFDKYYLDMIAFSEGVLASGATPLDLPYNIAGQSCMLGALGSGPADQVPAQVESLFSTGKKLAIVNKFIDCAYTGTSPYVVPASDIQNLITNGYRPIITWEMLYSSYPPLDPVQPRLSQIINGSFDSYIDAFAAKVATYSDTVIIRLFHEFEGDWYPWSVTENAKDPNTFISAFRHVVDRFRMSGVYNVKWMWCGNAEPKPYRSYNWIKACYPGDNYVDIVATDTYNHPNPGTPPWKSFRYTAAESYYYLTNYFPNKPLYICEVGCRERDGSEPSTSQSKADWTCEMDKELRSYFNKVRALVFFNVNKEHDWRINSSAAAQQAFGTCFWNNAYYGNSVGVDELEAGSAPNAFPNPFYRDMTIDLSGFPDAKDVCVYAVNGELMERLNPGNGSMLKIGEHLDAGIYLVEIKGSAAVYKFKAIKISDR